MRKNVLAFMLVLLLVFALAACGGNNQPASTNNGSSGGGSSSPPASSSSTTPASSSSTTPGTETSDEPFRLGTVVSASGPSSPLGLPEFDTIQMLVDEVNEAGGINGQQIELFIYDDKSDQNEAVLITRRLIEQDQVSAIIGGTSSGNTMAMIPIIERSEIPFIALGASKQITFPDDGSARHWTFKTPPADDLVIQRALAYMQEQGWTNVAFLSVANAYGSNGYLEFGNYKDQFGINELIHEEFEATVTDATAMLTRVRGANPDAIIVWGTTQESAVITRNIRDIGIDVPVINSHGIGNKEFIELAGEAAEGVLFPAGKLLVVNELAASDPQKDLLVKYKEDFESKFGYGASTFGGHAWDAFYIVLAAFEEVGTDKAAIRDYLENNTKDFVGTGGIFNFSTEDHNGLTSEGLVMIEIVGGEWKVKQ